MKWQQIETAPKDGTPVLAFFSQIKASKNSWERYAIAKFDGDWIDYSGNVLLVPTHWQPLEPPT